MAIINDFNFYSTMDKQTWYKSCTDKESFYDYISTNFDSMSAGELFDVVFIMNELGDYHDGSTASCYQQVFSNIGWIDAITNQASLLEDEYNDYLTKIDQYCIDNKIDFNSVLFRKVTKEKDYATINELFKSVVVLPFSHVIAILANATSNGIFYHRKDTPEFQNVVNKYMDHSKQWHDVLQHYNM